MTVNRIAFSLKAILTQNDANKRKKKRRYDMLDFFFLPFCFDVYVFLSAWSPKMNLLKCQNISHNNMRCASVINDPKSKCYCHCFYMKSSLECELKSGFCYLINNISCWRTSNLQLFIKSVNVFFCICSLAHSFRFVSFYSHLSAHLS